MSLELARQKYFGDSREFVSGLHQKRGDQDTIVVTDQVRRGKKGTVEFRASSPATIRRLNSSMDEWTARNRFPTEAMIAKQQVVNLAQASKDALTRLVKPLQESPKPISSPSPSPLAT